MIFGEEIKTLIPQREPFIMIDALYEATKTEAITGLTVDSTGIFVSNNRLTEPGMIEHIAQSASALAGYWAIQNNVPAPTGYIAEIRRCSIHFLPQTGDRLRTALSIIAEAMGVSLLTAETAVNGRAAIQCQMKIFIQPAKQ